MVAAVDARMYEALLRCLEAAYVQLAARDVATLWRRYRECLATLGQEVSVFESGTGGPETGVEGVAESVSQDGALILRLPNGERREFIGTEPGPHGVLHIRDKRLVRYVLKHGEVGFGEGYLDGLWDSPDLATLLAVMQVKEHQYRGP